MHVSISRYLLVRLPVFLRISSDFSVLGPSQPELPSDVQLIVRSVNEIPSPLNVCAFVVTNSLVALKEIGERFLEASLSPGAACQASGPDPFLFWRFSETESSSMHFTEH